MIELPGRNPRYRFQSIFSSFQSGPAERQMQLKDCYNFHDFRRMAKQRLPGPIFNYIDGAADDEVTYRRNTAAFENCDLVPDVLQGVADVDMSVTVMGQSSRCRSIVPQQRYNASFTIRVKAVAAAAGNSAPCSASPHSAPPASRKHAGSAVAHRSTNSISTKIAASTAI